MEEVREAVWDRDVTKSPGRFKFKFYKKAWSLICHDVMDLVGKGVNLAYVTLIPRTI